MHNSCSKTFRDVYWKHRCWNSFKSFSVSFERLTCKYTIFQSFPYDNYVHLPLIKPMSKMLCQKLYLTLPDLWISITMIHKMYNIEVDIHFSRMADRGGTAPTKTGPTTPSPPKLNMRKPLSSPFIKPKCSGSPLLHIFNNFPGPTCWRWVPAMHALIWLIHID